MNEKSKKSKKRQCIVHYAGLVPYSELKDDDKEKGARIRSSKVKPQSKQPAVIKEKFRW